MGVAAGSQAAPEAGKPTRLPALLPARQAVIYAASLTVRAGDVRRRPRGRPGWPGLGLGGYVSSETARFNHRHPADGTILIQLKIPVARYQATLTALSTQLGTRLSLSQRAQDVTQTVADVASRVASAQAAIVQLRRLLARARSAACSWSRTRSTPRSPAWRRCSPSSACWRTRPRTGPCR